VAVILAREHHWTPEQIARMDGEYVEEVLARIRAEQAVERAQADRQKRRQRQQERRQRQLGDAEDADITEIR
jgi:hypothetical protein